MLKAASAASPTPNEMAGLTDKLPGSKEPSMKRIKRQGRDKCAAAVHREPDEATPRLPRTSENDEANFELTRRMNMAATGGWCAFLFGIVGTPSPRVVSN